MYTHQSLVSELPTDDMRDCWCRALEDEGILYLPNVAPTVDHVALARCFGILQPQYDGKLVWDIVPDPAHDGHYHSLNTHPLTPHTEYYEVVGIPHRYQALWCVTPCDDDGGVTLLADGYAFLDALPAEEQEYLEGHCFPFGSSAGIQSSGMGFTAEHPSVERSPAGTIIRFSVMCMDRKDDVRITTLQDQWVEHFDQTCVHVDYRPGSFVIWDNWRVLHSRTGFQDTRRHLRRVFIDK